MSMSSNVLNVVRDHCSTTHREGALSACHIESEAARTDMTRADAPTEQSDQTTEHLAAVQQGVLLFERIQRNWQTGGFETAAFR